MAQGHICRALSDQVKFTSHSMIWQSGNKQAERQDDGIALSHRKQKVKLHVRV